MARTTKTIPRPKGPKRFGGVAAGGSGVVVA